MSSRALKSPYLPWLAAALGGLLLAACYPNLDRPELVWVWQAPLLLVLWFHPRAERSLLAFRLRNLLPAAWSASRPGAWALRAADQIDWLFEGGTAQPRWQWGFKLGYLAGLVFFLVTLSWLRHVAWPAWFLLSAYLASYFGAWGAFAASAGRLRREAIAYPDPDEKPVPDPAAPPWRRHLAPASSAPDLFAPSFHVLAVAFLNAACWVALEWTRGWMFTGFGWNGLGVALRDSPHLIQIADAVGVAGLSFLPMFVTCVVVATVARIGLEIGRGRLRPHLDFAAAMMLLILVFFYGFHAPQAHPVDDPVELNALLVQGNVSIQDRYDPAKAPDILPHYENLTVPFTSSGHDLIVWPETALPYTFYETRTLDYLNRILVQGDFHLLTGIEQVALRDDGAYDVFNSMVLMRGSVDDYQAYQKIHLVPFGEFIPFRQGFPLFRWALGRLIPEDFDPGTRTNRLRLPLRDGRPTVELIPSICFEDGMGRLTRRFVADPASGPQVIMNLTNDAWFERSQANAQHLANARFRCVELKRPMLRCANTGLTGAIDAFGSLADPRSPGETRLFRDDVTGSPFLAGCYPVRLELDSRPGTTIYARHGDWFARTLAGIVLLVLGLPRLPGLVRRIMDRFRTLPMIKGA